MRARWYTVEYDTNNMAWLVASDTDRVCLFQGLQVEVTRLAMQRPIPAPNPAARPRGPRKPKRGRAR